MTGNFANKTTEKMVEWWHKRSAEQQQEERDLRKLGFRAVVIGDNVFEGERFELQGSASSNRDFQRRDATRNPKRLLDTRASIVLADCADGADSNRVFSFALYGFTVSVSSVGLKAA
jgi:hypothetical protein